MHIFPVENLHRELFLEPNTVEFPTYKKCINGHAYFLRIVETCIKQSSELREKLTYRFNETGLFCVDKLHRVTRCGERTSNSLGKVKSLVNFHINKNRACLMPTASKTKSDINQKGFWNAIMLSLI